MEHQEENEAIVEPDEDGGWVDTHHHVDPSGDQATAGAQESFSEMTLDSDKVRIDGHVNQAIVEPDEDGGWVDTHHHVDPSGHQATTGVQESLSKMTLNSDKVRIDCHVNEAIVEPGEDGGWVDTHHHVDPSGDQATVGTLESFSQMTLDSDKVRRDSHVNEPIVEPVSHLLDCRTLTLLNQRQHFITMFESIFTGSKGHDASR